jgi:hypothetical protein
MSLIPESASRSFAKALFKTKKNSPHIFFGIGLVGLVGSVILACKATLDLEETIDEIRNDVDETKESNQLQHAAEGVLTPEIVERNQAKEVGIVTFKGALKIGRLYAPAIVLGGASVACLAGSHVQLTRRNAALTAAFTALSQAFEKYRDRVRDELGDQRELEIYRGYENVEIIGPNGKPQLVREVNPDGLSPYSVVYGPDCREWQNSAEFNRMFLEAQEKFANHRLRREGHLFLNDVYESLGLDDTAPGQIVGWMWNSENGDGYIDFGLHEARVKYAEDPALILDFNVDGVIWNKI